MKLTMKSNALKIAFLTLGGAALLAGCQSSPTGEPLSETAQQEWADTFVGDLINNEVSIQDSIIELEKHLSLVEDESFSKALEVFLYTLEVQVDRYNTILSNMSPEMTDVLEKHEGITFTSDEGWRKVKDGLVSGLRKEIASQPLKWVEDEESVSIEIDYSKIDEFFGEGMTKTLNNKIALSQHRIKHPDYDYENLHLNFENIWERIVMLEGFKASGDWDASLDDQYYYLTSIAYGFGEGTMNLSDGTLNVAAVESMRKVAEENKDHATAQNMLKIVEMMEKEGASNDAVLEFINGILNEQFAEYLQKIEEDVEESVADIEETEKATEETETEDERKEESESKSEVGGE